MQEDDEIAYREREVRTRAARFLSSPKGVAKVKEEVGKRKINLRVLLKDLWAEVRARCSQVSQRVTSHITFDLPARSSAHARFTTRRCETMKKHNAAASGGTKVVECNTTGAVAWMSTAP